jgi:hypothetical protein
MARRKREGHYLVHRLFRHKQGKQKSSRGWRAAFAGTALVGASLAFVTTAEAQIMLTASDGPSLVTALTTVDNNPGTNYTINITQNIALTAATTLPAITTSTLTINGGNFTLNGGGVQHGFFVYSGTVAGEGGGAPVKLGAVRSVRKNSLPSVFLSSSLNSSFRSTAVTRMS